MPLNQPRALAAASAALAVSHPPLLTPRRSYQGVAGGAQKWAFVTGPDASQGALSSVAHSERSGLELDSEPIAEIAALLLLAAPFPAGEAPVGT